MASSPCVVATTLSLSLSLSLSQRPLTRPTEKRERDVFIITPAFLNTQIKSSNLEILYMYRVKKKKSFIRCFGASTRHTVVVFFFFFFFFSRAERVFDSLRGVESIRRAR